MANQEKKSLGAGELLVVLLTVVFVTLKLCKIIDWSWWYVTMPLWGGIALALAIAICAIIIRMIARIFIGK